MFGKKADPLDEVIGWWGKKDPLTARDLTRNVAIFGQTGSGKSSGSGLMLARAVTNCKNTGGLILASKPEDREWWTKIFTDAGRKDDLLIMEPGGTNRCNILDYEMQHGADTAALTQFIMTMKDTVNRASGKSKDPFWDAQNSMQINYGLEVTKTAMGKADPWALKLFLDGTADSAAILAEPANITDEAIKNAAIAWKAGFHRKCLGAAEAKDKTDTQKHDFNQAKQYFLGKAPRLDPRTRSNIAAGVDGILHVYNTGAVRYLLASETTISPDVMEKRKWVLVDMPVVAGDASATFVNAAVKYVTQRHILRRKVKPGDPLIGIYCDEFPKVANAYDTAALAEIRSHLGFMITLAQSMPGMCEALGGGDGKNGAAALLCNQYIKVFHLLGDPETAKFASSLLAQRKVTEISGSQDPGKSLGDQLFGASSFRASFNEKYEPVLQESFFLGGGGLRTGGSAQKFMVDAVLIREGSFRVVSFCQK